MIMVRALGRTLGWSVFLAVSWTWCIGMFLPTLMIRDGGVPFFLAFLIPNVLGAASVGWVLRDRDRSSRFVAPRRTMMLVFSAVTIAFHAYFLVWRSGLALQADWPEMLGGVVLGISLVGNAIAVRRRVDWLPALVTLLLSACLAAVLVAFPAGAGGEAAATAVGGLAMVTTLGFLLCPYLDLTFNRAAQNAPSPRAAFTIGFFVIFLATILLVTRGRVLWSPASAPYFISEGWYQASAGAHFGAQAMFTVAAHIAAVRRVATTGEIQTQALGAPAAPRAAAWVAVPIVIGLALGVALFLLAPQASNGEVSLPGFSGPISLHEVGYRVFLGAYGLVFPAWLLMTSRGRRDLDPGTLAWTVAVCALAAPFLWIGAVGRQEEWLYPGVAIVLLGAAVRTRM